MNISKILLAIVLGMPLNAAAEEWPAVEKPVITSTKTFLVTNYGASTTSDDNTAAIQAALDACAKAGGGKVIIPAGTYLCGPLKIQSCTHLEIQKDAVLQLLPYGKYPLQAGSTTSYQNFIESNKTDTHDIIISGKGRINGDGDAWWTAYDNAKTKFKRGAVIRLNKARRILIRDITINNAPGSHITIGTNGNSSNASIKHVTIDTKVPSHNTDGIDVWGPNVDIDSCYISCGDDNVAINKNSQYVRITNCDFGYGHGTSVGSYTSNVKHVLVDHCTYTNTDNGVRLKSNVDRGGLEEDFMFSNLTMTNVNSAVWIDGYYDKQYTNPANDKANALALSETTPAFRDIYFKNITSTSNYKKYNSIFIYGRPESHFRNITFDHVKISAPTGAVINFCDGVKFINGCDITPKSGSKFVSTFDSTITEETAGVTGISTEPAADTPAYDLNGRKVTPDYQGIVIQNGKASYQQRR